MPWVDRWIRRPVENMACSNRTPIPHPLLSDLSTVWMSHGDRITRLPRGFVALARSGNSPYAAMGDMQRKYFGVQFHPEVHHTPNGEKLLQHFVLDICGAKPAWTPKSIIDEAVERVRKQVGNERVLAAVSGGVDSSVAAALVHEAIGDQLVAVFVDTGLLRMNEGEQVASAFRNNLHSELITVDASEEFLFALAGVTEPEQKRRIVGEKFIRVFEAQARQLGQPRFLVQGTIYPDVVESSAPIAIRRKRSRRTTTSAGCRRTCSSSWSSRCVIYSRMRYAPWERRWGCRKRSSGGSRSRVGADRALSWGGDPRARLPSADGRCHPDRGIIQSGLSGQERADVPGFYRSAARTLVGVMGDQRTYQEAAAIRAVSTEDFMTADWSRLPHDLLARISSRIVNEVDGINRVVYDITSKPPATIEWE